MDLLSLLENSSENLFITGKAGCGKSTLLRKFVRTSNRGIVVCAPTGIAAINAEGQTIHSLFRIPPRMLDKSEIKEIAFRQSKAVKGCEILVIDEGSMQRADMLDLIDQVMQHARKTPSPFGGCKLRVFGDLYQLPPIVAQQEAEHFERLGYQSPYFFASEVTRRTPFKIVELMNVFRQKDDKFIQILNDMRAGHVTPEDMDHLNSRVGVQFAEPTITICPYNQQVQLINDRMISELPGNPVSYQAEIDGDFPKSAYPNDQTVKLKPGAQVMFLRNQRRNEDDFRYANGTLGIVQNIMNTRERQVIVRIEDKSETAVIEPICWESYKYEHVGGRLCHQVSGTFKQIPLRACRGVTIHKSQGKTFNRVCIDIGKGAFDFGQTYVALSRCRSLDGISLAKPLSTADVMTDERIVDWFQSMRSAGHIEEVYQEFDQELAT